MEDLLFLREWGFLSESEGNLRPTRAAVLLLGKARHVRRLLPRPVVDFQIIQERFQDWSPDRRWSDRIVVEDNIIQAWLAVVERYMKHADRPFEIDVSTLRRHDEPPDYISFREAAINLLIHQDYGDVGRHAQIQMFRDRTRFWNPGDAFGTFDQLLEPGAKEVRNPNIVAAFRRIGLSDQAGMGIRAIFANWRRLGNVPPLLINQRAEKAFELSLLKERLLSDNQRRFQKEIGVHLSDMEAGVFAFACREDRITLTDARAVGGLSTTEASALMDHLVLQKLLEPLENGKVYSLVDHLRKRYLAALPARESGLESGEELATQSATQSGDPVYRLLRELQNGELSSGQLRKALGIKHRPTFRQNYLHPALESGLIEYTIPEKPQSRLQKYRLSDNHG
jgi:ATP-dependent DNA helicase RecG